MILDEGPFAGRHLFQTFVLSTSAGRHSFEAFLAAVKVQPENHEVDVKLCKRKVLRVTVKHREQDGRVYANVRGYAAAEA